MSEPPAEVLQQCKAETQLTDTRPVAAWRQLHEGILAASCVRQGATEAYLEPEVVAGAAGGHPYLLPVSMPDGVQDNALANRDKQLRMALDHPPQSTDPK